MTNDYGNHTLFLCLKLFDQGKTVFRQFSVIFRDLYTHIIKNGKYLSDTLNQKKMFQFLTMTTEIRRNIQNYYQIIIKLINKQAPAELSCRLLPGC